MINLFKYCLVIKKNITIAVLLIRSINKINLNLYDFLKYGKNTYFSILGIIKNVLKHVSLFLKKQYLLNLHEFV